MEIPPFQVYLQGDAGVLANVYERSAHVDTNSSMMQEVVARHNVGLSPNAKRTTRACDVCRRRKTKCDGREPKCRLCEEERRECSYRLGTINVSSDKALQIDNSFRTLEGKVEAILSMQMAHNNQIEQLKACLESALQAAAFAQASTHHLNIKQLSPRRSRDFISGGRSVLQKGQPRATRQQKSVIRALTPAEDNQHLQIPRLFPAFCWSPAIWRTLFSRTSLFETISSDILGFAGCESTSAAGSVLTSLVVGKHDPSFPNIPLSLKKSCDCGGPSRSLPIYEDADVFLDTYVRVVHVQYPFLKIPVLKRQLTFYTQRAKLGYCKSYMPTQSHAALKRKRQEQPDPEIMEIDAEISFQYEAEETIGSMADTIVHLVLAIGTLCKYRSDTGRALPTLSSPRPEGESFIKLQMPRTQSSPSSVGISKAPSDSDPMIRDVDTVPGLHFFLSATKSFAEFMGDYDLSYVQANLLASLYLGLLAQLRESSRYLVTSQKVCQALLEESDRASPSHEEATTNLLHLAAWNCFKYENELTSEKTLTLSGRSEDNLGQRGDVERLCRQRLVIRSVGQDALQSFLCEMQLRRILDDAYSELYAQRPTSESQPSFGLINALNYNLYDWHKILSGKNGDVYDRGRELNVGRIQTRYYAIKHVITRPALEYLLYHSESRVQLNDTAINRSIYQDKERTGSPFDKAIAVQLSRECLEATIKHIQICCQPAILCDPNLLNTLNWIFSDLLLLSVVFISGSIKLSACLDGNTLKSCLISTISLFEKCIPLAIVLGENVRILRIIYAFIWP